MDFDAIMKKDYSAMHDGASRAAVVEPLNEAIKLAKIKVEALKHDPGRNAGMAWAELQKDINNAQDDKDYLIKAEKKLDTAKQEVAQAQKVFELAVSDLDRTITSTPVDNKEAKRLTIIVDKAERNLNAKKKIEAKKLDDAAGGAREAVIAIISLTTERYAMYKDGDGDKDGDKDKDGDGEADAIRRRDPVPGSIASRTAKWRLERNRQGGIATRKKYRRRNKRKTKHYKKKAKRYTKKRNRRY
jgi:hypothetical protein